MWGLIHKFGSPKHFYRLSGQILPWVVAFFVLFFSYGLIAGLAFAPPDYQQGDSFRIIYFHVPSAFFSLSIYVTMATAAAIGLIWRIKVADMVASSCAPIGASFTFLALVTGAIWGKPTWGTWWVWDARLTSELILLFLYLGYMALQGAIEDKVKAAKASALLALVGVVNIPIIHFSVTWWNTLHQGATLSKFEKPSMDPSMLWPLLAMIVAFGLFFVLVLLLRTRCEVLDRERHTNWVQELVQDGV